jgi:hypothetical protein
MPRKFGLILIKYYIAGPSSRNVLRYLQDTHKLSLTRTLTESTEEGTSQNSYAMGTVLNLGITYPKEQSLCQSPPHTLYLLFLRGNRKS